MNWCGFNVRAHSDNTDSISVCLFGCLIKTMKAKLYKHWKRKRNEMFTNYVYYENISFHILYKNIFIRKKYLYFHRKMSKLIDYTQTKARYREKKSNFLVLCNWNGLLYPEQRVILSSQKREDFVRKLTLYLCKWRNRNEENVKTW